MKHTILTLIIILLGFATVQARYHPSFPGQPDAYISKNSDLPAQ